MALVAESALGRGLRESEATTGGDHHQIVVHVAAEALPEGSEVGEAVLERSENVNRWIEIDAEAGLPTWRGGPVDVGSAVRALRVVGLE